MLHQGLIQQCEPRDGWQRILANQLAPEVVVVSGDAPYPGFDEVLAQLCREKYMSAEWNDESHGRRKSSQA